MHHIGCGGIVYAMSILLLLFVTYRVGSINRSGRNMAMGSGFMESNGSLAVSQLNSNTDQVFS